LEECEELEELRATGHFVQTHQPSFFQQLRVKSVRKRLGVGIGLMIAQNMVGLNALNYYAPTIFMSSGFTSVSSSLFLTGIFGIVKLLSALSFMFFFVHLRGNRFWLKFGSTLCGASMLILAFSVRYGLPKNSGSGGIVAPSVTVGGLISVSMVYIFAFSFGISLGPLSWNICSEIFPAAIKAQCCAITTCIQWLFQIVIAGITPHLLASAGWITYLIYATFCAGSLIFVVYYVPETKDVKLGRKMDALFGPEEAAVDGEIREASEVTALLRRKNERVRRDSVGFSV